MKKVFCLVLALMMVFCVLAGCGEKSSTNTTPETNGETNNEANGGSTDSDVVAFKLGGTAPLTGGAAIYGNAVKNGAQIAVDEINAMDDTVKFELNYQDDEHDAEKAVNAYNALKDWGVQLSLGSVTTTPCIATSAETFADRIFALTPSASAPAVIEGKDNMFQMCFSDTNQGSASAQYIFDNSLGEQIAVIYKSDDNYSKGIYNTFIAKANELGLEVVSETTFTSDSENDFTVQLTGAKNAGADLLFLPMYYQPASLILQQANAMGYTPEFFGVDGMDGILTLENFDTSLAEGVMLLTPFNADATDEHTVSFVTKYNDLYGETPNQFAADAYDCVYAYYYAIKASGATADMTAEELCDLMITTFTDPSFSVDGLTGEGMTWIATGEISKQPKGMVIKDGAYIGM